MGLWSLSSWSIGSVGDGGSIEAVSKGKRDKVVGGINVDEKVGLAWNYFVGELFFCVIFYYYYFFLGGERGRGGWRKGVGFEKLGL